MKGPITGNKHLGSGEGLKGKNTDNQGEKAVCLAWEMCTWKPQDTDQSHSLQSPAQKLSGTPQDTGRVGTCFLSKPNRWPDLGSRHSCALEQTFRTECRGPSRGLGPTLPPYPNAVPPALPNRKAGRARAEPSTPGQRRD